METDSILHFWFGHLDADGRANPDHRRRWYRNNSAFDSTIAQRFRRTIDEFSATPLSTLSELSLMDRVAAIIVLDQFPRNVFRGSADAFRYDAQALAVAETVVGTQHVKVLPFDLRAFAMMPYQHCERVEVQRRGLEHHRRFLCEAQQHLIAAARSAVDYMQEHAAIIERFGRFPHRNKILGRASSRSEQAFLRASGKTYGQ